MKPLLLALAVIGAFSLSGASLAATEVSRVNVNIKGTIVSGKCTFDQRESVTIDFGDVKYVTTGSNNTLDGEHRKTLPVQMTCKGDSGDAQMTFKPASGGTVSYDGHTLLPATLDGANPGQDLAIRLLVNGVVQDVSQSFAFDVASQPTLEAELVQVGSGSGFTPGAAIAASATLVMEFI
ncbi:fimbrial protein [Enterobacter sp.]|uniref:fimbrial protein n=1 Tax=Enterobacter sp. TaxID=42895 RepID=UPI0028B12C83|nr:fimbrial protein [Enterobacter sp.]